jgi:hypothetical protein
VARGKLPESVLSLPSGKGEAHMGEGARQRHPSIYLLGDHLDAALAMGEDLLTEKVALIGPAEVQTQGRLDKQNRELAEFLANVRALELSLTARLLQARKRAEELKRHESRLKPLIALFVAGTAPLVDAAAELGDTSARDFDTGGGGLGFLRSRGLIARDAGGLERLSGLAVGEDYLVAARIRLGTLLDLVATFLDTLDLMFDLYSDAAAGAPPTEMQEPAPAEGTRLP